MGATVAAGILAHAPAEGALGGGPEPRLANLRCLSECAGLRRAAVGGKVQLNGRRLATVSEVRFTGDPAIIAVAPDRVEPQRLVATVPPGAVSGRPRVMTATGAKAVSPERLGIAEPGEVPNRFRLAGSNVKPGRVFFDQPGPIRLKYRFEASERTGVRVEVVRAKGKRVIRTFRKPGRLPYSQHSQGWDALESDGDAADDGTYRFRVGAFGERSFAAGELKLFGYRFPVRGPHGYGGAGERFGAPRSGGRVHQGQDIFAACGTPLEAARGGRVEAKAYDPVLYGHYVVIDAAKTSADHMYVHMASPSRFGQGDRVHTGERIGNVGRTGNASAEPCQLHFEIWPSGWRHGSPVDPEPTLRRWDGWS